MKQTKEGMAVFNILITFIVLLAIIFLWLALYDTNRFVLRSYTLSDARIRKGFRMVVLADLHSKRFDKKNARLLSAIRDAHPDMIMIAGDMFVAKPKADFGVAKELLEELEKDYPIYYGNGNHEHRIELYPEVYGNMAAEYEKAMQELGIHRLVNEHVQLSEYGVSIYGLQIDKYYYTRFRVPDMEPDYLESVLGKADPERYTILIAHNPDYFPDYASWGADLVLSGHVHGGIVRIPFLGKGVASPNIRLFPKYDGGLFSEGRSIMLLSRGLGVHTIPFRLFNPGEILVVDVMKEVKNVSSS